MDEKSILLMSEELRAALGERSRSDVESDALPGRWSRMGSVGDVRTSSVDEIHIAARVVKCTTISGKGVRLTLRLLDETRPGDLIDLIGRAEPVSIWAGSGHLSVSLRGWIRSVRVDGGSPVGISILVQPAT